MIKIYCVIQEIPLKKPNKYGSSKELEVYSWSYNDKVKWCYRYSDERFERPINKAYKISIHESKRVNGVVTKKQKVVTTMNYYDILEFWIGDCVFDKHLESIASYFNTTYDNLIEIIHAKLNPLEDKIKQEFKQTEEYKTKKKHQQIIDNYNKEKSKFAKKYDVDSDEYDYCYNVFGELMNRTYLDNIIHTYKNRSYQKSSYSNYNEYSNFNYDNYSSYFKTPSSNYTETEKGYLKKIYRTLSKEYHPDNTKDNGNMMSFINELKAQWGI